MTFYKFIGNKTLQTPKEQADYFKDDMDWLLSVTEDMNIDASHLEELSEPTYRKIKAGQEWLEEESGKLVSTLYLGDAEWWTPLGEWNSSRVCRLAIEFTDGPVHRKWLDIARKYYEINKLSEPNYSRPGDVPIKGENPLKFVSNYRENLQLQIGVMHLEWLEYVCSELEIDLDQELVEKTKRNSVKYFVGEKEDLEPKIRSFQSSMFENDAKWLENTQKQFGIRSLILRHVAKVCRKTASNLKD